MTSINALRFDGDSGVLVCDEQRHWNPERMKIFAVDKIRPVVPEDLSARYGLAACYGNTGTSTIGEELRATIRRRVAGRYESEVERQGDPPETFLSMEEMARLVFEVQAALKRTHVDEQMRGRYGFSTADLCRGWYLRGEEKVEIGSPDIGEGAELLATWKDRKGDARPVFGNSGILGGYAPEDGFRLFRFSMAEGYWTPVEAAFIALGSGLDAANMVFAAYASTQVPEGSGRIDPVEGCMVALSAVNAAARNNLGVGGYFNITLIDGRARRPARLLREINDHRSRLCSEVVRAQEADLVSRKAAESLIEGILFKEETFEEGLERFHGTARSPRRLRAFLRGWG